MIDEEKRVENFWKVIGLVLFLIYAITCAPGCIDWFAMF